jgi:hypothetical protein
MSLQPLPTPRFVRRTRLGPNEYRKNFRQLDREVINAVTSPEADRVTPLMSKIYLRLANAPENFWEREGVLRFEAGQAEGRPVRAWALLCELLGVASATANKALRWMHEQGIIGYFAGKNGVGIRIFLNRATSSIGTRAAGKKILEFTPASSREARTSADEAAFSDSFADLEILETDLNPRAPKSGAEQIKVVKIAPDLITASPQCSPRAVVMENVSSSQSATRVEMPVEEIVSRIRCELESSLESAAKRAAAQEHERTREWLESRGLPKAARVAQREAFNVLRKYGVIKDAPRPSSACVGRNYAVHEHQPLSDGEVEELAQACVAMLEVKEQSIELTLSEMSAEAGGFLLPEDAPRVRDRANILLAASSRKE